MQLRTLHVKIVMQLLVTKDITQSAMISQLGENLKFMIGISLFFQSCVHDGDL